MPAANQQMKTSSDGPIMPSRVHLFYAVARARARLTTDFDWTRIAARTAEVLRAAQRRPPVALGRPTITSGDLLGAPER